MSQSTRFKVPIFQSLSLVRLTDLDNGTRKAIETSTRTHIQDWDTGEC